MSNPDGKFDVTRDVADGAQQGQAFVAPAGGVGRGPVCRRTSARPAIPYLITILISGHHAGLL